MRRAYWIMFVITVLFVGPAFGQRNPKRTVAVTDFDFSTVQKWWEGNWDIGRGISDALVDELLKSDTYRVLERRRLEMVIQEQRLTNPQGAAGRANLIAKL